MSGALSQPSSAGRSTVRFGAEGSERLTEVLKSGILGKRGRILDLIADGSCIQSRTFLDIDTEEQDLLELFDLSFLYASLFSTILEDALLQLKILGDCNSMLHIMRSQAAMNQLRAEKYGVVQVSISDELEGVDRRQLGKEEYKLKKLAADSELFHDTVLETYVDLALINSFESLAQRIAEFYDRDTFRDRLVEEEAANRMVRRDLARQLRLQRNHILSANYDMDASIDHLRAQVEDSNLNANTRSRYVRHWQAARTEQHEAVIEKEEAAPTTSILTYKQKLDDEQRAHVEVTRLINFNITETMEKVEQAMQKYDSHMENIDLQIQIMKNNYQNQVDVRTEMEEKYKKQETDITGWRTFVREREEARQYQEKMNKAAVVAQAWWRGLLLRLQLGPYKQKRTRGINKKQSK